MTKIDKYGDLPGTEVMRDLITVNEWYSTAKKSRRTIEHTNIIACADSYAEKMTKVPRRLLYNFALIGLDGFSSETTIHILT